MTTPLHDPVPCDVCKRMFRLSLAQRSVVLWGKRSPRICSYACYTQLQRTAAGTTRSCQLSAVT